MENQNSNSLFNKEAWKAIVLAFAIVAIAALFLSWQYNKLVEESEEKLSSLQDIMEQGFAQDVLENFIKARVDKNESQANLYLTEVAMEQKNKDKFVLIDNFKSYFIYKSEKTEEGNFRFFVKLYEENEALETVEIISVVKILENYYINSVEIAG